MHTLCTWSLKSLYIVDVARVSEMHANQFDTLVTHVCTTYLE